MWINYLLSSDSKTQSASIYWLLRQPGMIQTANGGKSLEKGHEILPCLGDTEVTQVTSTQIPQTRISLMTNPSTKGCQEMQSIEGYL